MTELEEIGTKICTCFDAISTVIESVNLTTEEIDRFGRYLDELEISMPITDPTQYLHGGQAAIALGQSRAIAVKNCILILEAELAIKRLNA